MPSAKRKVHNFQKTEYLGKNMGTQPLETLTLNRK